MLAVNPDLFGFYTTPGYTCAGVPGRNCYAYVSNAYGIVSSTFGGTLLPSIVCPSGATGSTLLSSGVAVCTVSCADTSEWNSTTGSCAIFGDLNYKRSHDDICLPCLLTNPDLDPDPPFGNPIYPLTGSRRQDVDLGVSIGGLPFNLTYDTASEVPEASGNPTELVPPAPSFGALWESSLHKKLVVQSSTSVTGAAYSSVSLKLGAVSTETAGISGSKDCSSGGDGGSSYSSTTNPNIKLQMTGTGSAATLLNGVKLDEEIYDSTGAITTLSRAGGGQLSFSYTSGLLTGVTDQFGRIIQFVYEQPANTALAQRINLVTAADGSAIQVGYDASNNLHTLTWADGSVRTFVYENTAFSWALTGIVDESSVRYSTYGYDAQGLANSTYLGS